MKIAFAVFLLLIGGGGFSSPAFSQTASKSATISVTVLPHLQVSFAAPSSGEAAFSVAGEKSGFFNSIGLRIEDTHPEPRVVHLQMDAKKVNLTLLDPL